MLLGLLEVLLGLLEVLLDVLEMLLEVLELSWSSWSCPGGPRNANKGGTLILVFSVSNFLFSPKRCKL